MTETELVRAFAREFAALEDGEVVALELTKPLAWTLMTQLQLALRHPGNTGPSAEVAQRLAVLLQMRLAPEGSALWEIAQRGWKPAYDLLLEERG